MRLIDADEIKTAFPCGEYVRTESVRATIDHTPSAQPDWGKPVGDGRPLADSEIIPRLQDIKEQVGGSYAIDRAIEVLEQLPSAQPDVPDTSVGDMVSRQMALHIITGYNGVVDKSVAKRLLTQLPSVQPEIIRCKDCKWWCEMPLTITRRCSIFNTDTAMTFFCKHGRRENE